MEFKNEVCFIIAMFLLCITWALIGISQFLSKRKATLVLNCAICAAIIGFIANIISLVVM